MAVASYILPRFKAIDDFGRPMVGAKLYTYQNKTTTPAATYQDAQQSAANTNPIVLNASGEAIIYLLTDQVYTFVLKDANDVSVWSQDDVTGAASPTDVEAAIDRFAEKLADPTNTDLGAALVGGVNRVVDTVADVRKQRGIKNPYVVATGYYARNDKQPSFYVYDPADSTTADNGFTVLVSEYGDRYKLNHPGWASIDEAGAKGDGVTDDSARIQVAFDWASTTGIQLRASARTYGLKLSQRIALEGYNQTYCALIYKTRVKLHGAGMGATVFKLLDNESTDASPKWFNLMAANTVLDQIDIQGITFNVNGQNNPISPNRGSGVYNAFNCAALMVSGSVATVGVDARVTNSRIMYNEIVNIPGVTGIALGQRFGHSGVKGSNVEVSHNRFYNNGIDSADHSSIYGFDNECFIHDNTFDFPTPSTGKGGPVACVECFGSNISVYDNFFRNYMQFAWIGAGEEGEHRGISIYNNKGYASYRFVDTWSFGPQNDGISQAAIYGNQFTLTGDPLGTPGLDRVAINLVMNECNLVNVAVFDNKLTCTDRTNNTGIVLFPAAGQLIGSVFIQGNTFNGFSRGIGGGGNGPLFNVVMKDNNMENMAPTTSRPTDTIGIQWSGNNYELSIANNHIIGGDLYPGTVPKYGITLAGTIARLNMEGNDIASTTTDILVNAIVSGRRTGRQALTFAALPAESTWKIGDTTYLYPAPLLGVSPNRYIMDGWQRMTDGTANVLGVDWQERRMLTGT